MRIPFTTSVVKTNDDKLIPPVSINNESVVVPDKVPLTIVEAEPNVIRPVHLLIPLGFLITPWLVAIPVPLIVIGSGMIKVLALTI